MHIVIAFSDRGGIDITGRDARDFLQGLITQDITLLGSDNPLLYSAFLTPQGKYLYDFFVWHIADDHILIELEQERAAALSGLLTRYVLGRDVQIAPRPAPLPVWQIIGSDGNDPRHAGLGTRTLQAPDATLPIGDRAQWTALRLSLTPPVPDCAHDLVQGVSTPFEGNIDLLNGISFTKGCYLGQELVSRIHHRGLVKHRFGDEGWSRKSC